MRVEVDLHDIDFSYFYVADLMRYKRSDAERIVSHLRSNHSQAFLLWRAALNGQSVPNADKQIAGKDWTEVLEILDRADVDEISRWLRPIAEGFAPKPVFVGEGKAA